MAFIKKQVENNRRFLHTLFARFVFGITICLCLGIMAQSVSAQETQKEERKIRVGYPVQSGMTMIDKDGKRSGYTYEYLNEIAQYTGWKYEFVQVPGTLNESLIKLFEMLKNGEIDILGGVNYFDELTADFDYTGFNYGLSYSTLSVLEDNTSLSEMNLIDKKVVKVAVLKSQVSRINLLEKYADMNKIKIELVYAEKESQREEMLYNGVADALLSVDLSTPKGMRIIAKFAPQPYYFAVSKGNKDILNAINSALLKIEEVNPYLQTTLYEKYFTKSDEKFVLSDEEKEYISNTKVLRAGIEEDFAPIQYFDKKTGQLNGISKDVLEYVSEQTGLKFELVMMESSKDYHKMMQEQQIDIISGISYNYHEKSVDGLLLTLPYLSEAITTVINKNVNPQQISEKRLALVRENRYEKRASKTVTYYDTIKECLDAVNSGKADFTYGNSYTIQYYQGDADYRNLMTLMQTREEGQQICIGVLSDQNIILTAIINKVIESMPSEKMQEIIYKNAFKLNKVTFLSFVHDNPMVVVITALIITFSVLLGMFGYVKHRVRTNRKLSIDNERYRRLGELTGESVFEYDYSKDRICLSDTSIEIFGGRKEIDNYLEELKLITDKDILEKNTLYSWILEQKEGTEDISLYLASGGFQWYRVVSTVVYDSDKKPAFILGKIMDNQKEIEEKEHLQEQAQKDSLTNIYNAATSKQMIAAILDQDEKEDGGALWIIDIDRFKSVNDQFGHYVGDQVLAETAAILRDTFRAEDIVGRLGGDEFVIYTRNISSSSWIDSRHKKLQEKISEIETAGQTGCISVSVGIIFVKEDRDFNSLYQKADEVLYRVKNGGRKGYQLWNES